MQQRLDLEVGDARAADVGHAHAERERVDQVAHHHVLALHGLVLGEPRVRVQRVMVHRDHAEEMVVVLGDRLAGPVPVDVARDEVLEVTPEGPVVDGHSAAWPGRGRVVKPSEAPGSDSPSMVSRQANRVPGRQRDGPEVDGQRHVDGRALGDALRLAHGELAAHLDRLGPLRRLHQHRLAVGILEKELPVVRRLGLVPVDVDLQRDGGGHGSGPVMLQPPPRM